MTLYKLRLRFYISIIRIDLLKENLPIYRLHYQVEASRLLWIWQILEYWVIFFCHDVTVYCRSFKFFATRGWERGGANRIRNAVNLVYFMMTKFLWDIKTIHHMQGRRPPAKCAYRARGCKLIVVHARMDFLFPIWNENVFSYLCNTTFWILSFHL